MKLVPFLRSPRHRRWLAAAVSVLVGAAAALTAGLVTAGAAQAASGCQVSYSVTNQWQSGFGANVTITNLGEAVNGWKLTWSYAAGQTITQLWNGSVTQSGSAVTVADAGYNGAIPTGGTTSFGFNGSWNNSSNPVPASFALNGVPCNGPVATGSASPSPSLSSASPSPSASRPVAVHVGVPVVNAVATVVDLQQPPVVGGPG